MICKVRYNRLGHVVGKKEERGALVAVVSREDEIIAIIVPFASDADAFEQIPLRAVEFSSWE